MREGERRVVVTGMGALTPVGNDVPGFWDWLVNGRSGITRITAFDPVKTASKVAGEIKGWDAETVMPKKEIRRNDRYVHYAWGATVEAMADAGLANPIERRGARVAHRRIIGSGIGGINTMIRDIIEATRARHRADRPVPGDRADPGHGGRLRGDLCQCAWSELRHGQRVLEREPRDRRLDEHHPPRRRRRHDRRRRRGGHRRDPGRRVQRHARPVDEVQRRPRAGVASVRRGARRVRDGGRRRHPRPRGARARAERGARRSTPRSSATAPPTTPRTSPCRRPAAAAPSSAMRVAIADAGLDARATSTTSTPTAQHAAERPLRDGRDQDALRRARLPRSRSAARSR